jgi:hypothetical protein
MLGYSGELLRLKESGSTLQRAARYPEPVIVPGAAWGAIGCVKRVATGVDCERIEGLHRTRFPCRRDDAAPERVTAHVKGESHTGDVTTRWRTPQRREEGSWLPLRPN